MDKAIERLRNAAKLKEIFKDISIEATFDTSALEKLPNIEPKLCKIKRELSVTLSKAGTAFKIKGSKEEIDQAKEILGSKLEENENIIIRGVENAPEIASFLAGKQWGEADTSQQLQQTTKDFDLCSFAMFLSRNSSQTCQRLFDLHCEMKAINVDNGKVTIEMKGPEDYVDSIFSFIEGEYRAVWRTVDVFFYHSNSNKYNLMDVVQEKLKPVFMLYQGSFLHIVFSKDKGESQDNIEKQVKCLSKQLDVKKKKLKVTDILEHLCEDHSTQGTVAQRKNTDMFRKKSSASPKIVKLDSNRKEYLRKFSWQRVVDEAFEVGILPEVVQDGIQLSPMTRNFETDCKLLDSKLIDFTIPIKSKTIDISNDTHHSNTSLRSQLEQEAKTHKVLLDFNTCEHHESITITGTDDGLEAFVLYTKALLDAQRKPNNAGQEMQDMGSIAHASDHTWETLMDKPTGLKNSQYDSRSRLPGGSDSLGFESTLYDEQAPPRSSQHGKQSNAKVTEYSEEAKLEFLLSREKMSSIVQDEQISSKPTLYDDPPGLKATRQIEQTDNKFPLHAEQHETTKDIRPNEQSGSKSSFYDRQADWKTSRSHEQADLKSTLSSQSGNLKTSQFTLQAVEPDQSKIDQKPNEHKHYKERENTTSQRQSTSLSNPSRSRKSNAQYFQAGFYMTVYQHNESRIKIHCGVADITKIEVDCIVNAANSDLNHCGGVAYAIAKAAGSQLERESESYIRQHGRLNIGQVCVTNAGKLPCKKVLHTVGPMWSTHRDQDACLVKLQQAFYNCMETAEQLQMSSIAFPAISSGIYGVPLHHVSSAACMAMCTFCVYVAGNRHHVTDIYLIDRSSDSVDYFNATLSSYVTNGALSKCTSAV